VSPIFLPIQTITSQYQARQKKKPTTAIDITAAPIVIPTNDMAMIKPLFPHCAYPYIIAV